ncbi:MAG: hypothetical protein LBU22_02340 [Dysgonamonadaceae bacterium]|jgi:hypothetical protein|nr:hypothetical protein [Dysgonamonadaceae bacterium]
MNKWHFILWLIFTSVCLHAQSPQRGIGMGGGNRQGPPPGMSQRNEARDGAEELRLDSFPPIPDITLEQRVDVGNILAKEQKDTFKLHQKKRELLEKDRQSPEKSEKDRKKMQKEMDKIDSKIEKRIEKSNKKIRKILSEEQYRVFLEKRNDFIFRRVPPAGSRLPEGSGGFRERPGGMNQGFGR